MVVHIANVQYQYEVCHLLSRRSHSHDDATIPVAFLQHKIERKFPSQLDQSVIPGFGHDQNVLNVRAHSGTTCIVHISH